MSTCWVPVVTAKLVYYFISMAQEQNLINHFTFILMLPSSLAKCKSFIVLFIVNWEIFFHIVQLVGYLHSGVDVYITIRKKL